jgi:hypothetical protein
MPKKTIPFEYLPIASGHKFCHKCQTVLLLTDFYHRYTDAGSKVFCSECKECHNAMTRKNYALNQDYYVQQKRDYYNKKREHLAWLEMKVSEQ